VQNKVLLEQYQAKKKQLEEQNPSGTMNERELWHGTSIESVDSINAHGFNRSFCGKNSEKNKACSFSKFICCYWNVYMRIYYLLTRLIVKTSDQFFFTHIQANNKLSNLSTLN
jgi:hypothetical protein